MFFGKIVNEDVKKPRAKVRDYFFKHNGWKEIPNDKSQITNEIPNSKSQIPNPYK